MKKYIILLLLLSATAWGLYGQPPAGKIAAYEYWFDNGFAARQVIPVATPDAQITLTSVDAGALEGGIFTLHFRARDEDDNWTVVRSQAFLRIQQSLAISPVAAYEYWFDNGFAERTEIAIPSPDALFTLSMVDAGALGSGIYTLHFRARDADGNWSVVRSQAFLRMQQTQEISPIAAYEYWFDDDFAGRKTVAADEANPLLTVRSLDASGLEPRVHTMYFRARNDDGLWSAVYSQAFLTAQHGIHDDNLIAAYRYWINDEFMGTVALDEPVSPYDLDDALALPDGLDVDATHTLTIQFADLYDNWTEPRSSEFKLADAPDVIPVTGLYLFFDPDEPIEAGVPLVLIAEVDPEDATFTDIVWTVASAGTTGASITVVAGEYVLNTTAAGTVRIRATVVNGIDTGEDYVDEFEITVVPAFVAVTDITGVPATVNAKTPLTLTATVTPSTATNKTIVWTVKSAGSTGATITGGNVLNTTSGGTATVTATIANGATPSTAFAKDFAIEVTPITGIPELTADGASVYPNPFDDAVRISMGAATWRTATLHVTNAAGVTVHTQTVASPDELIRLGHLPAGVYFFRVDIDGRVMLIKAVKQ